MWLRLLWERSWRWQVVVWHVTWNLLSRITEMRERQPFCQPLSTEFSCNMFNLQHAPLDDFFKSQWQKRPKSICWLVYRWAMAAFFSMGVLSSAVDKFREGKWFIYLTHWGFILCMFTFVLAAVLASIYYHNPEQIAVADSVVKMFWVSHYSTLILALVITSMYWYFLYPDDDVSAIELFNMWEHGCNSIAMLMDHMLVAFPTRIVHVVYPIGLGVAYTAFTLLYHFAGGLDTNGNTSIYYLLDWSLPAPTILTVSGTIALMIFYAFVVFGLYKLRTYIHRKCCNAVDPSAASTNEA